MSANPAGLKFDDFFGVDRNPYEGVTPSYRTAEVKDFKTGEFIFRQENVIAPDFWSDNAVGIVASKFFHGDLGSPNREFSVYALVDRVVDTIADFGWNHGYFNSDKDRQRFSFSLKYILIRQMASFNSPVWFNVGVTSEKSEGYCWDDVIRDVRKVFYGEHRPQGSACFIQSVSDNMESIMDLVKSEAMLFKRGSGTGTDLTPLRSTKEKLSGGGKPSGPVSFLKVYDRTASIVKSGGKTRRAARMNTLKCHHPDILQFIRSKSKEEKKAQALIAAGYDPDFNGEAYDTVAFQNTNITVRVTDGFIRGSRREDPSGWDYDLELKGVDGQVIETLDPAVVMDEIAQAAWECGDPGVQYEDTIQKWHTCKETGPINSSNPCSEFMFLDDTACNLASINLMKFRRKDGTFDVDAFRFVVRVLIAGQDILVDLSGYPTAKIAKNSHNFRPLGLGYANLGALVMSLGLPYDSDDGRDLAGAITSLMSAEAYHQSSMIAEAKGPFNGFNENRESMLDVMESHRDCAVNLRSELNPLSSYPSMGFSISETAALIWCDAFARGMRVGFRNSQVTVLAPTGTIGFMMDCDTLGIEPDIALVKNKNLAGGGSMRIVNQTVSMALERLQYTPETIDQAMKFLQGHGSLEPVDVGMGESDFAINDCDLSVFDTALPTASGRCIAWQGHLKMMAAVQSFLSGAISKTINMPSSATVEDVRNAYLLGHELGLKAVAIYRNNSKESQPINTIGSKIDDLSESSAEALVNNAPLLSQVVIQNSSPQRHRLPDTRKSLTHKFTVGGHEGYLTVGLFEDGKPGELFVQMAKEGSTLGGLMDSLGTLVSLSLQYGIPLGVMAEKFRDQRFEPSGFTRNRDIPISSSLVDYIFRWMELEFTEGGRERVPKREPDPVVIDITPGAICNASVNGGFVDSISITTKLPLIDTPEPFDRHYTPDRRVASFPGVATVTMEAGKAHVGSGPACDICGSLTVRSGSCYACQTCGSTSGCS